MVQARARATRTKILDQAAIAFARDGYDAASLTSDILEPAGVSVGSFYHQFNNKLDVLFALLGERLEACATNAEASLDVESLSSLGARTHALMNWLFDHVDAEPELSLIQLRERWNSDHRVRRAVGQSWAPWRLVLDGIAGSLAEHPERQDAGVRMVGRTLVTTLGHYLHCAVPERAAWRDTELPYFVDFCLSGLHGLAYGPPVELSSANVIGRL